MKRKIFYCVLFLMMLCKAEAQLIVSSGGTVFLEVGSVINVQGNLTTNSNIQGTGKISLSGTAAQLNANGFIIPNLDINSAGSIALTGNCIVSTSLNFSLGKIQLGNSQFTLSSSATITGVSGTKFIETTGNGLVKKELASNGNYTIPVGANNQYMPLSYTVSAGSFGAGAFLGTQLLNAVHPNKPLRAEDYLNQYWKTTTNNITGAVINATANYQDASSFTGNETSLNALRWDGANWSSANNAIDVTANTITYNNIVSGNDLYAMNKFVLARAKVFLQGAYNAGTGLMGDNLRTVPCLIPTSDPYRTAPYNIASFSHFNNTVTETVNASVFNTQLNINDNIVDWVFLELRDVNNILLQTRSALLQRDGDIVDIDGTGPVFFKNIDAGNFVLSVRHRNHLGVGAEAATYAKTLNLSEPSTANVYDFTTASDAQIFGTSAAYTTANHPTLSSINLLWGGNANFNVNTKYTGLQNDKDYILVTTLGNSSSLVLSNIYSPADINMNRAVRFNGLGNDKDFLYITILGSSTTNQRVQALPN